MNEFEADLKRISDNYVKHLPEVLNQIESSWQKLSQNLSDKNSYEELLHLVHNLSGSAGVFGCPEIGDVARKLQELLSADDLNGSLFDISAHIDVLKEKIRSLQK